MATMLSNNGVAEEDTRQHEKLRRRKRLCSMDKRHKERRSLLDCDYAFPKSLLL